MKIWEYTFAELVGGATPRPDTYIPFLEQAHDPRSVVILTDRPRFATAMVKGSSSMADQVLLARYGDGWRCIGHWIHDTITISPEFARAGLATELFLRVVEHRSLPITANFTQSGHDLLKRVHWQAVAAALKCAMDVPDKVLNEYPDLQR